MLNPNLTTPMRPDIPLGDESIRLAREYNAAERAKVSAKLGVLFTAEGRAYLPKVLPFVQPPVQAAPVDVSVELAERMDAIVEEFGLAAIKRYVVSVTAMNEQEGQ